MEASNIIKKKHYTFLVLGESGNGKTSFSYTLTKNEEKFIPKAGNLPGTKEIVHGNSKNKNENNQYTVIDTIGFAHEDFKSSIIKEKLFDYLRDHSQISSEISAIIYIISIKARNNFKTLAKTIEETKIFDFKSNVVIVFTEFDLIDEEERDSSMKSAYEISDVIFKNKTRTKVVFWINEHPTNKNRLKNIENNYILKEIHKSQENNLIESVSNCEPLVLNAISDYCEKLKSLFSKSLKKLIQEKQFVKKNNEVEQSLEFSFKMKPNGKLDVDTSFEIVAGSGYIVSGSALTAGVIGNIMQSIAINIVTKKNGLKIGAGYALGSLATLGETTFSTNAAASAFCFTTTTTGTLVVGTTTATFLVPTLMCGGIALIFFGTKKLYQIYKKSNELRNRNEEIKSSLENSGNKLKNLQFSINDIKETITEIMKDNKLDQSSLLELSDFQENKIIFSLSKETNNKMKEIFDAHYKMESIIIQAQPNFSFKSLINNEKSNVEITWNQKFVEYLHRYISQNIDLKMKINFKLSIELPNEDSLNEQIEKDLLDRKDDIWKESLKNFPI